MLQRRLAIAAQIKEGGQLEEGRKGLGWRRRRRRRRWRGRGGGTKLDPEASINSGKPHWLPNPALMDGS